MAGEGCRCVICGCCRHDHAGWNHAWKPKEIIMTTRAKFRCSTVEQTSNQPIERKLYPAGGGEPTVEMTWPRKYRFMAVADGSTPENQRYAQYTPSGELTIQVDNPNVAFEPGTDYYLDFTPVPVDEPATA